MSLYKNVTMANGHVTPPAQQEQPLRITGSQELLLVKSGSKVIVAAPDETAPYGRQTRRGCDQHHGQQLPRRIPKDLA